MNRETLDGIVKQGLAKYADQKLVEVGEHTTCDREEGLVANSVLLREEALALLRDDARRLAIVDRILKEMKP